MTIYDNAYREAFGDPTPEPQKPGRGYTDREIASAKLGIDPDAHNEREAKMSEMTKITLTLVVLSERKQEALSKLDATCCTLADDDFTEWQYHEAPHVDKREVTA